MSCSKVETAESTKTEERPHEPMSLNETTCYVKRSQKSGKLQRSAALDEVDNSDTEKNFVTGAYGSAYTCITQYPYQASIRALCLNVVGPGNLVARWAHGSKLSYFVSSIGLDDVLLDRIKTGMKGAADQWRTTSINISFEETPSKQDAVFLVELDPKLDASIFAKAFFPGDARQVLDLSPVMLDDKHENHIANIFCHELGHVLGLRHDFRGLVEQNVYRYPAPKFDQASIMNCENVRDLANFTLSNLDRMNTHRFYDLPAGPHCGFTIKDYIPQTGNFGTTMERVRTTARAVTEEATTEAEDKRWLRPRSRNWSKWYHDGAEYMVHLGISYPGVAWDASSPYQTR
jgi:hypothetical protein